MKRNAWNLHAPIVAAILLAAGLPLAPLPAMAEDGVALARKVYGEVNGALAGMAHESFTAQRRGVEYRSDVKAWRDANGIRKAEVTDRDDSGNVVTEYYYSGGRLAFAYVAVRGLDGKGREVTRVEQRQYFQDGRMVQWLGGMDKAVIAPTDPAYAAEGKERLAAAAFYRDAAEAAFTKGPDTVRVGGEVKRATGKVIALTNGDTACVMELEDARGARFVEQADFAICFQKPPLAGRRVALDYRLENVMAEECQGNPDCRKTKRIPLVVGARPLEAAAQQPARAPAAAPGQSSFCTPMEEAVFACRVGAKLVSVCASKDAARSRGYVQYRFGKPDSRDPLELAVPEDRPHPPRAATGATLTFSGGGGAWMRFRRADHAYVVYTGIGRWGPRGETQERAGLVVERNGRAIRSLRCSGRETSQLGPDWFARAGIDAHGEDFELPP